MQVLNKGNNLGTELISQAIDTAGGSNVKLVRAELAYDNQAAFNNIYQASHDAISSVNSTPLGKSMSSLGFEVDTIQVPSTGFPKVTFKNLFTIKKYARISHIID